VTIDAAVIFLLPAFPLNTDNLISEILKISKPLKK